jgi:hypothetical protein
MASSDVMARSFRRRGRSLRSTLRAGSVAGISWPFHDRYRRRIVTSDERDRRRQILSLTDAGLRLLRQVEKLLDDTEPGPLAALSGAQRAALHAAAVGVLAWHTPGARTP